MVPVVDSFTECFSCILPIHLNFHHMSLHVNSFSFDLEHQGEGKYGQNDPSAP